MVVVTLPTAATEKRIERENEPERRVAVARSWPKEAKRMSGDTDNPGVHHLVEVSQRNPARAFSSVPGTRRRQCSVADIRALTCRSEAP